jgi:hypothetical protein
MSVKSIEEGSMKSKLEALVKLVGDVIDDQITVNDQMIKAQRDIVTLLESMEAANGLLEARVQMLEANDGS